MEKPEKLWTERVNNDSLTVVCNIPGMKLQEFRERVEDFLRQMGPEVELTFVDITPPDSDLFMVRVEWYKELASRQEILFICDMYGAYDPKAAASRSHYDR